MGRQRRAERDVIDDTPSGNGATHKTVTLEGIPHLVTTEVASDAGYQSIPRIHDQLHVSSMSKRERMALAYLYGGLRQHNVEVAPFKPVSGQQDAIRWLLGKLADAYSIE